MKALWIGKRDNSDPPLQIFPPKKSPPSNYLRENKSYFFELRDVEDPGSYEMFIDDKSVLAVRSVEKSTAKWIWDAGFYAGIIEIKINKGILPFIEARLTFDPDKEKLTRNNFNLMIGQILEDTMALFSISSFRKGIKKGKSTGTVPPLARLEFLRSNILSIESIVRSINRNPVRILSSSYEEIPSKFAKNIKSIDLIRSFKRGDLFPLPPHLPFSDICMHAFPKKIQRTKKKVSIDIGEHRVIKNALVNWRSWLQTAAVALRVVKSKDTENNIAKKHWAERCTRLALRISELLELPIFKEVENSTNPLVLTSIFRWVAPYRRFFNIHRDIGLGLLNIQGDFLEMPLARTFELYELWAFLRILKAAVKLFDVKNLDTSSLFTIESKTKALTIASSNVDVSLSPEFSLHFQRIYKEYWLYSPATKPGSFSRTMVPDVSFETKSDVNRKKVVVIDAKYRVDTQLNDAISSLHMYRDAIVQESMAGPNRAVTGAYIVTPHIPGEETAVGKNPWKDEKMPGRLFHPVYRSNFNFGAITLTPTMTEEDVISSLKVMLSDAGITI